MANLNHALSRYDYLLKQCLDHRALNDPKPLPQVFGYLLDENPVTGNLSKKHIVTAFDELVESMRSKDIKNGPADAGMTFLGQFIDHDITLDARSAIGTRTDPRTIRNIRTPNLDLDCVYGDGPDASPHLYSPDHEGFMLLGRVGGHHGWDDNPYDLARNCKGRALIGDPRNDENIIVSQVQGAFIALHNILMSHVVDKNDTGKDVHDCAAMGVRSEVWDQAMPPSLHDFEQVRRFIRLHYQYIILNDFMPSFVDPKVIESTLDHDPFHDKGPIMPAEFSVAAYRFGHATVQPEYSMRKGEDPIHLFQMHKGFGPRGSQHDLEFAQFFDVAGTRAQKALPVGTKMADTLFQLPDNIVKGELDWGGYKIDEPKAKKLALRNILRDRTSILLPSGQQMARSMHGISELAPPKILKDNHIDKTPLWFYCLQEAEERGKGKLTGVGGSIVASVIIRLLKLDPESVLNVPGFTPWSGFGDKCNMANMMAFVEKHRGLVANKEDLYCG